MSRVHTPSSSALTVSDCALDGQPLRRSDLPALSSAQIARLVGHQQPAGALEDAADYTWRFAFVPLERLRCCLEGGGEPEEGWKQAYLDHEASDREAIANGSPEYAGRQAWLRTWCADTRAYPLYLVEEAAGLFLWDGHHRLAGAFWHDLAHVAAFVGRPR